MDGNKIKTTVLLRLQSQCLKSVRGFGLGVMLCAVLAGGCHRPTLAPSPNLYTDSDQTPFQNVPTSLRSSRIELLYATDRAPIVAKDGAVSYGYGRSHSLAVGVCAVTIGKELAWDDLVRASKTAKRQVDTTLTLDGIREVVRFPSSSRPLIEQNGVAVENPDYIKAHRQASNVARGLLDQRLAAAQRKEVFVFIHGYHNHFEAAAFRMAQLWHFMGRQGVPIIYTWPAGHGGLLRGYMYDHESGEFTLYHLKQFLKAIGSTPGLEKIHIVAHSRGTDVILTALRELHLELSGSGVDTRSRLKLGTLVLAAADLDWQVAQQRIGAERTLWTPEHVVLYLSREDRAIGLAGWLFASVQRIGRLSAADLTAAQKQAIKHFPELEMIDVQVDTGYIGHAYFISNPAVLSDLILLLRDGRSAGAEHGRPLIHDQASGFWKLRDGYPNIER